MTTLTQLSASLFGLDVMFESNHGAVLDCARGVIEDNGGEVTTASVHDPLTVRLVVETGEVDSKGTEPPRYILGTGGRLFLHSASLLAVADPVRKESLAYLDERQLERADFASEVVEALVLALVASRDRHPVHAAAIEHRGRAVLLAGPSGAGKSTLAYLAHQQGYHVLGEDRVWVQLQPSFRVWGGAGRVRLLAGDGEKRGIPLKSGPGGPGYADRATLCILERGGEARLDPLDRHELRRRFDAQLAPGFDRFPDRYDAVADILTQDGGFVLTLSNDPADALPPLRTLLGHEE